MARDNGYLLLFQELAPPVKERTVEPLPVTDYDRVLVQWSGGKDSLACILHLLDLGVDPFRIELWHQRIDGAKGDDPWMDWPCTDRYVELVGEHLGLPVLFQYREGGFRGELFRENARPGAIVFERAGMKARLEPMRAEANTRRKFPAPTADLSRRWCSGHLKIDVAARSITNDPTLDGTRERPIKVLFVSGERREESPSRARYAEWEEHRTNSRSRIVHQWRPVIDWPEQDIWAIIRRYGILPHPAYLLGWNRCSCFGCIFSTSDLWSMMREIAPDRFEQLAQAERDLEFTIDPKLDLHAKANLGCPTRLNIDPTYRRWALNPAALSLSDINFAWPDGWFPAGAFHGHAGGSI
jgi:3'-phosphoadenosine 5'-phosphosulfate sulfotransferase (PAPS reductase)/FAD synthetase